MSDEIKHKKPGNEVGLGVIVIDKERSGERRLRTPKPHFILRNNSRAIPTITNTDPSLNHKTDENTC